MSKQAEVLRPRGRLKPIVWLVILAVAMSSCVRANDAGLPPIWVTPAGPPSMAATPAPEVQPSDRWLELQERFPYPYRVPLPDAMWTPIDGVYVHNLPQWAEHVHCRRCPDYLPEGGLWRVSFDRGVFRIYSDAIGWRNLASYVVDGDRLTMFNDPVCPQEVGEYRWEMQEGVLQIDPVEDVCAVGLRAANLASAPWESCRPPNQEAAVSDHWPKPEGCR